MSSSPEDSEARSSELIHPDTPPRPEKIHYQNVAFYGRTLEEYEWMFHLKKDRLCGLRVLDCHGRASSFVAEGVREGIEACALDPLYDQTPRSLEGVGRADMIEVLRKTRQRPELYNFDFLKDIDTVQALRETALERFLKDYPSGLAQGRYWSGQLPELPFGEDTFDLVLNNHYLFLYGDHFDYETVLASCREMSRVCAFESGGEVRIYPLLGHNTRPYQHLQRLRIDLFHNEGISAEIVEIPFQFLKGSNQMMILRGR